MKIKELDSKVIGKGYGITYANGKYYMVSEKPAKVCVSEDLENWTDYNLNEDYLLPKNIAYGNGVFVVSGDAGITDNTYIYYSNDGENWIPKKIETGIDFSIHLNTCKFINNRFAVTSGIYYSDSSGKRTRTELFVFTSKNGINWTKYSHINNDSLEISAFDIEYGNGKYVLIGRSGAIFTSLDLKTWYKQSSGTKTTLVGISFGRNKFIITGDNGIILTSENGKVWYKQNSGTDSYLIRSKYVNGMYIAIGYNGTILQSIDGNNWKNISNKNSGLRYGLAYNSNDQIVITGCTYTNLGTVPLFILELSRDVVSDEEDSSLFFFDTNFNMLGVIDYFISFRWRRKYFEAGEFEIVLPVNDYIKNLINENTLVMRNNYTEAGIIETVEFNGEDENETVTISGRFLSSILQRRIVKSKINYSGYVIEGMNTIINSMTPFTADWETVASSMDSPSINFQVSYKNVYEFLCKMSCFSNIGFRVVPNIESKVYMFEVYKGLDRTSMQSINNRYAFSDENENIKKSSLLRSIRDKINYVLVGGTGEDSNRILVEVKTKDTGFNLFETFSDEKSTSSENLTVTQYKAQLKDNGRSLINNGTLKFEVTGENFTDYKNKWDLGDIVDVEKQKWDVFSSYRIIEVEEIIEDSKRTIFSTFASPEASAWENE